MSSYYLVLKRAGKKLRLLRIFHGFGRSNEIQGVEVVIRPSKRLKLYRKVRKALQQQGFTTPLIRFKAKGARKQAALLAEELGTMLNGIVEVAEERGNFLFRRGKAHNGKITWCKPKQRVASSRIDILPDLKRGASVTGNPIIKILPVLRRYA